MTDGELIQKADDLNSSMTRDAADFADRGVDAIRQGMLTAARTALWNTSTDEEMKGLVTVAVGTKNGYRGELENGLRQFNSMAKIHYKGQGLYTTFVFTDMTKKNDDDFARQAKHLHKVATDCLDDLANEGLTIEKLGAFSSLLAQYDESINQILDAEKARDLESQLRVERGNHLFDLVMEFANIGKSIYADTNEAKYNDYVIHDEAPVTEEEPVTPAP